MCYFQLHNTKRFLELKSIKAGGRIPPTNSKIIAYIDERLKIFPTEGYSVSATIIGLIDQ